MNSPPQIITIFGVERYENYCNNPAAEHWVSNNNSKFKYYITVYMYLPNIMDTNFNNGVYSNHFISIWYLMISIDNDVRVTWS